MVWRAVLVVPSHEPPRASLVRHRVDVLVDHPTPADDRRHARAHGSRHRGHQHGRLVAPAGLSGARGPGTAASRVTGEAFGGDHTAGLDASAGGLRAAAPADREALYPGPGADAVIAGQGWDIREPSLRM